MKEIGFGAWREIATRLHIYYLILMRTFIQ